MGSMRVLGVVPCAETGSEPVAVAPALARPLRGDLAATGLIRVSAPSAVRTRPTSDRNDFTEATSGDFATAAFTRCNVPSAS